MYYFNTRNEMLQSICKPGMRICEVGVFMGDFARFLVTLRPSELVLIDPWKGETMSGNADGNNPVMANLDEVYPYLCEDFGRYDWIKMHRAFSADVLKTYDDEYFDVIYIDGDHSYEGCKADLEIALKKVKRGGWIMGHDYEMNEMKAKGVFCAGVNMAVNQFCERYDRRIIALGLDGCVSYAIPNLSISEEE